MWDMVPEFHLYTVPPSSQKIKGGIRRVLCPWAYEHVTSPPFLLWGYREKFCFQAQLCGFWKSRKHKNITTYMIVLHWRPTDKTLKITQKCFVFTKWLWKFGRKFSLKKNKQGKLKWRHWKEQWWRSRRVLRLLMAFASVKWISLKTWKWPHNLKSPQTAHVPKPDNL